VQKPGKSKQDYQTPTELLMAVRNRLHISDFKVDLAATQENRVTALWHGLDNGIDSLAAGVGWNYNGWAWLNPPYADITPWVEKAARESMGGAHIVMLVPASVGANWWRHWVEPYAYQSYLNGRIQFVGAEGLYPKDCAILLYTPWGFLGHEIWNWKSSVPQLQQPELGED
jgi:DNA (cytosine-5)-methyltransferase 1